MVDIDDECRAAAYDDTGFIFFAGNFQGSKAGLAKLSASDGSTDFQTTFYSSGMPANSQNLVRAMVIGTSKVYLALNLANSYPAVAALWRSTGSRSFFKEFQLPSTTNFGILVSNSKIYSPFADTSGALLIL